MLGGHGAGCRARVVVLVLVLAVLGASHAHADPSEETSAAPTARSDYAEGKRAVDAKDWTTAIRLLSRAEVQDDRNADVQNLLGYAYRNAGRLDEAFRRYERALRLNPRHRGAHEYIGEAYLLVDDLPKAEAHLATLKQICVITCEESEDLEKAIARYRSRAGR